MTLPCLVKSLLNFAEMERVEQDLVVLGLLEASRYSVDVTTRGLKRKKQWFRYVFAGEEICAGAFRTIYGIGTKVFDNLKKHLETCGPVPRRHGNTGRKPKHAMSYEEVLHVVQFLKNYSDHSGIPYPATLHSKKGTPPIFLPASDTIKSIHKDYVESCGESDIRAIGYYSFRAIWLKCLPHVRIMTPRTDVCDLCEVLRRKVVEAVTEAEKLQACQALTDHISHAQSERDFYRHKTADAQAELTGHPDMQVLRNNRPCDSDLESVHYTFDYAQNVSLPHSARQVGPIYFKVPRKVHVFGVKNEALPHQVNYLLDEADTIGMDGKASHGPNSVASMLHHFFMKFGLNERECFLHADNCSGQNKNRTLVAYLAWRVMMGLHTKITLSFMISGHMRCLVDGCFGLMKQKFRRNDCSTLGQLEKLVNESATCNKAQLVAGSGLLWYAWDVFLAQHFKPIPGIRSLHHLVFDAATPGVVSVQKTLTDEPQDVIVLRTSKEALQAGGMPTVLQPGGLSEARKEYLYKQVRPHVPAAF